MNVIDNFEKMLAAGQDNTLLRFGLGQAYLNEGQADRAIEHLRAALGHDQDYSAAWKLLGKALAEEGEIEAAMEAYEKGIAAAEQKGDIQAAKEMKVFLKRLHKTTD